MLLKALFVFLVVQIGYAQAVPQDELQRRIEFADKHFATRSTPGSKTDRGKVYILLGPPDQIKDVKSLPNTESLPWEEWTYRTIPGIGTNVCVGFVDLEMNNSYRMVPSPCDAERNDDVGARRRYELIRKRLERSVASASRAEKNAH